MTRETQREVSWQQSSGVNARNIAITTAHREKKQIEDKRKASCNTCSHHQLGSVQVSHHIKLFRLFCALVLFHLHSSFVFCQLFVGYFPSWTWNRCNQYVFTPSRRPYRSADFWDLAVLGINLSTEVFDRKMWRWASTDRRRWFTTSNCPWSSVRALAIWFASVPPTAPTVMRLSAHQGYFYLGTLRTREAGSPSTQFAKGPGVCRPHVCRTHRASPQTDKGRPCAKKTLRSRRLPARVVISSGRLRFRLRHAKKNVLIAHVSGLVTPLVTLARASSKRRDRPCQRRSTFVRSRASVRFRERTSKATAPPTAAPPARSPKEPSSDKNSHRHTKGKIASFRILFYLNKNKKTGSGSTKTKTSEKRI